MSDRQWIIFNQLGGAEWFRDLLDKKAPMPKQYYNAIIQQKETNHDRTRHQPV
jgi:hypothetical protein